MIMVLALSNTLHITTVVQTAWKVGRDAVEAGTALVPVCAA